MGRCPTPIARAWLVSFLERVRRDPNVVSVIAIGSAVRGGVASEDLDLVVLCHDAQLLKERPPIEVDLHKASVDCVEQEIRGGGALLIWAVRFGQSLMDDDAAWEDIVERWKERLPLPDPGVSRERAGMMMEHMKNMRDIGDEDAFDELNVSYLTHRAWACLAKAGIFPASRPELPRQLRGAGEENLAGELERALSKRASGAAIAASQTARSH